MKLLFRILLLVLLLSACSRTSLMDNVRTDLHNYVDTLDAQVGIAIISGNGDTLTINNDYRYVMMSVFKFHQSLALCDYLQREGIGLDDSLYVPLSEMSPDTWSPLYKQMIADGVVDGKQIGMGELIDYLVRMSDNNVSNFLYEHCVSPQETDAFIREKFAVDDFSIKYTEGQMQDDHLKCYDNWTTPYAAALLIKGFLEGDMIAEPYKTFVMNTLTGESVGTPRLAVPFIGTDIVLGHKTGSGYVRDGRIICINDIGFVQKDGETKYIIAVFVNDSGYDEERTMAIIAHVSEIVAKHFLDLKTD